MCGTRTGPLALALVGIALAGLLAAGDDGMRSAPENAAGRWPVAAQDPDGDPLTYRLSGADAASFEIDESSGLLASKASLDYETKSRYAVTVTAADPSLAQDTIRVTISVQNEDEAAALVLSAAQPALDTAVTATLTDADGGLSGWDWVWERSSNRFAPWTEILGAKSSIYTPVEADLGQYLRVTVTYTDGHGPDKSAQAMPDPPVLEVSDPAPGPGPGPGPPAPAPVLVPAPAPVLVRSAATSLSRGSLRGSLMWMPRVCMRPASMRCSRRGSRWAVGASRCGIARRGR